MSSPSRENLRVLAKVNTESIAMASHSQGIVSDKNSRTQAYANRMKRGKIVRPRGEFITSSSMADITREYEELQAKQTRLQTRQEIRMHLKRVRGEMQKIREDYKVGKKQLVNGRVKTLNFKPWLEFTGRDVEFYTLEQSCDTLMRELKEPSKESFFYDTTKRNNSARDVRARAATRPRPLTDMSSLPGSDDTVYFTGLDLDKHSEDGADDEDEDNLLDTQENIPSSPPLAAVEAVVDTPCPRPRTRSSNKIQQTLQEHRYG
ncbi:hypothetical protein HRG_012746 [Hirsutella rhossiliensis]